MYVSTQNRIDLGDGKIIQIEPGPEGFFIRLIENRTFITPHVTLTQAQFDTLLRCAGAVDLGWIRMERMDRMLWIVHRDQRKLWAEVSWAKVWRAAGVA
jgi:hypothetical protein